MDNSLNKEIDKTVIMPDKILILGNGFNRWLGLNTSYLDYKKYLEKPENLTKYSNCYKLLQIITNEVNDKDWSKLEDDMINWLNDKHNLDNLPPDIDYVNACIEKVISLKKWVYSIREENKEKLDALYEFLKSHSKTISIWSFNYVIDYLNVPESELIINTTPGNPNKRAVTQPHWMSQKDENREDGTNERVNIEFGGNYSNFNQKTRSNWDVNQKCLIKFCTKFNPMNLCRDLPHDVCKKYSEAFHDNITKPYQWAYGDAMGLQNEAFRSRTIREANYIGFSFGKQDMPYFENDNILNLIKYCKTNFTFFKEGEDKEINNQILEIYDKVKQADPYVNRTITPFTTDNILKHIFGEDFKKLEKIKNM